MRPVTKTDTAARTGKGTRALGAAYEDAAAVLLERKGYRILARNFRCRRGEIDLVAADGDTVVFCEVKYRTYGTGGDPLEAIDRRKQNRIIATARYYLYTHGYPENVSCRFDAVSFTQGRALHLVNAFTA